MYDNIKYNDPVLAPISALIIPGTHFFWYSSFFFANLIFVSFNYVKNIRYIVLCLCWGRFDVLCLFWGHDPPPLPRGRGGWVMVKGNWFLLLLMFSFSFMNSWPLNTYKQMLGNSWIESLLCLSCIISCIIYMYAY